VAQTAADPFADVPRLARRSLCAGERWVFSAGFNVEAGLHDTQRIDCELADIRRIADAGGRVVVLSHQGRHGDGSARPLDDVAGYLQRRLGRPVHYLPDATSEECQRRALAMGDGEIALLGNTRHERGEEDNDPQLAARFARLGDVVAIGGFSKAHRAHASNVGLLRLLPGFAAQSLIDEVSRLERWAQTDPAYSLAILGGAKHEKLTVGLTGLCDRYDLLIPGGLVLNALLLAAGYDLGSSPLGDLPNERLSAAEAVLNRDHRALLYLPTRVVVSPIENPRAAPCVVHVSDGVPPGHAIVDLIIEGWVSEPLRRLARSGGRAVLAGPPGCCRLGFSASTLSLLRVLKSPAVETILLGGDTVAEVPFSTTTTTSTGGGSALEYLCRRTGPVLEALRTTLERR
jgi:phosphoglycerate kinase